MIQGAASPQGSPRVIRRYPNRRLYDTQTSSYVSLAELKRMVLQLEPFAVQDSKTGADVTRATLLQILLEAESAGLPLFSEASLAHLIRLYGMSNAADLRTWFESQLAATAQAQQRLREMASVGVPGADWLKPWLNPTQAWMPTWPGAAAAPPPATASSPASGEASSRKPRGRAKPS